MHAFANQDSGSTPPIRLLVLGVVVTLAVAVLLWIGLRGRTRPAGMRNDAYAAQVQLSGARVLHADSLMAGGVTLLEGQLENAGEHELTGYSVDLVFVDVTGSVIKRETRMLIDDSSPLAPGRVRSFQIGFDDIPSGWNQAVPQISAAAVYVK